MLSFETVTIPVIKVAVKEDGTLTWDPSKPSDGTLALVDCAMPISTVTSLRNAQFIDHYKRPLLIQQSSRRKNPHTP